MHPNFNILWLEKILSFSVKSLLTRPHPSTGYAMVTRYEQKQMIQKEMLFFNSAIFFQIKIGEKYVIQTKGLLVRSVDESDDGIYTCRAAVIQTGELVERNIHVEVQVLPKVQPFTFELEGVEDQAFSVKCNATGKPVPTYTWIKDSEQLNVENADR